MNLDLKFTVILGQNETVLKHSPNGWEDVFFEWVRSPEYFGLSRGVSIPIIFVLEGAYILRKEFYSKGLKASGQLKIEILNYKTQIYQDPFYFDFDFSTFDDRENEVEITLLESGIKDKIKALENNLFEIPLSDPEAIEIEIPGIGIIEKGSLSVTELNGIAVSFGTGLINFPDIEIVENGFNNQSVTVQAVDAVGNIQYNQLNTSDNYFLIANENTSVGIKGEINGEYRNLFNGGVVVLEVVNDSGEVVRELKRIVITGDDQFSINVDFEYVASQDEKLFLIVRGEGSPGPLNTILVINSGSLFVSNSLNTQKSTCKALRPYTLFQRLLAKINGGPEVPTRSFFLNSDNCRNIVVTCGDAIRGLEDAVIKTNFSDFFKTYFSVCGGVGFSVESGVSIIENLNYYFSDKEALNVGEINDFNLSVYSDFIISSIKIGYQDNEYEIPYGREEVNSEQSYSTPNYSAKKEYNLMAPYRADQLGIDEIRLTTNQENESEEDKKADNDVFIIKISDNQIADKFQVEGRENYQLIEGFTARNDYYNLSLTPKKNLLKLGPFIRSCLFSYDANNIFLTASKKNKDVRTIDVNNISIKESDPVNISSLGEALFIPYQVMFKCKLNRFALNQLRLFNSGFITFRYKGFDYSGYCLNVSFDPARNSEREFTLLLRAGTNVKNLIH